ncbi:MAG: SDR family NAD(P)-dependent oxidoreductase, partial [Bradyrhizobium sp.]
MAIVTGAGSGIGRASALAMAADGAAVTVVDRNAEPAAETAAMIVAKCGRATAATGDVSKAADVARFTDETASAHGRIDILFNNAGIQLHKSMQATSEEEWDTLFAINVKGMFLCAKAVIPVMERSGGGVILNAAWVASFRGLMGGDTAYVASKGAVIGLTRDLAIALAPKKIRVVAICPG